jgi:cobalt/nickel transport system ATP-binding protein
MVHHTLEVQNISFSYPDGHQALNNVSLRVGPNERVALVGPNGAGKSTFMLHLNGLLRCAQGEVYVGGLPVTDENLGQIRAWVGLVFQNPDDQLFNPKVIDDVAFGPLHMGLSQEEVLRRSREALEAVGMAGFEDRISHHLSIGQKKRITIATVLSMDPKILVLDEPSAGLDPRARRSLINLLDGMEQEIFPRTVILDEGQVVADGDTHQVLNDEVLLAAHGLERY